MSTTSQGGTTVEEVLTRDILRFTLKWTIENVKRFKNYSKSVYSKGVTMAELGREDIQRCRWYFGIKPCCRKGDNNDDVKCLSISLIVDGLRFNIYGDSPEFEDLDTEFSLLVTTGKVPDTQTVKSFPVVQHSFFMAENEREAGDISHTVLFGSNKELGLIKDDCITIFADILVYKDPESARLCGPDLPNSLQRFTEFAQRQVNWLKSTQPRIGDFTLVSSEGKELPVSRFLLMAHSPVFAAMLTHDTKEKQESRCVLKDVDEESVEILLEHLYSCGNTAEKIAVDKAEKVLIMADQCGMMDLRLICEGLLTQTVTAENAVHYLVMARQRGLNLLKEAALKVIPKNLGVVLKGTALDEAMQEPEVVQTILEHCSKKMKLVDESCKLQG